MGRWEGRGEWRGGGRGDGVHHSGRVREIHFISCLLPKDDRSKVTAVTTMSPIMDVGCGAKWWLYKVEYKMCDFNLFEFIARLSLRVCNIFVMQKYQIIVYVHEPATYLPKDERGKRPPPQWKS